MSDPDIIRVCVRSKDEMGFLGNVFGEEFLLPLLRQQSPPSWVLALCGPHGVGKTTFLTAAVNDRLEAYLGLSVPHERIDKHGIFCLKHIQEGQRTTRYMDLGYLRNRRPKPKLSDFGAEDAIIPATYEIIEHPDRFYLDRANVMVLFGQTSQCFLALPREYYHPDDGWYNADQVSTSPNIKAAEIAQEMRDMGPLLLGQPSKSGFVEQFKPLCREFAAAARNSAIRNSAKVPLDPFEAERLVTILLATHDPGMRAVYNRFRMVVTERPV